MPPKSTARGMLHRDKGHDTDALRRRIEVNGTVANVPPKMKRT